MNYAQQNLHAVTAELEQARATVAAFTTLQDSAQGFQQITLTSLAGSVTCALPAFKGKWGRGVASTFYAEIANALELRVASLEERQVYWCREMVLLADSEEQDAEAREERRLAAQGGDANPKPFASKQPLFAPQPIVERCPLLPNLPVAATRPVTGRKATRQPE